MKALAKAVLSELRNSGRNADVREGGRVGKLRKFEAGKFVRREIED
jgi:hypothetical protein